jgi:ligand-binding SRPBCC domain-containing protein
MAVGGREGRRSVRLHRVDRRQTLSTTIEQAWSFFSDPRNLAVITPPDMRFEVLSEVPERIYAGLLLEYRVQPFPGWQANWVTEITQVVAPHRFVDEQRIGPYRFWHHQHHFRELPGGVEVRDLVHYSLPGGPLGALVNARAVAPRLAAIFDFREGVLAQRFAAPAGAGEDRGGDGAPGGATGAGEG